MRRATNNISTYGNRAGLAMRPVWIANRGEPGTVDSAAAPFVLPIPLHRVDRVGTALSRVECNFSDPPAPLESLTQLLDYK